MNKNVKDRVVCIVMAVLLFGTALVCMFKPLDAYSFTERRSLKKFPQVSVNTILSGSFMTNFEDYTLDQFPLRDLFRGIKAVNELFVFQKTDNNKLYLADGHISKIEYPYHPDKITNAADKMNAVYERYLKDTGSKVYLSVIPDKNAFLAEKNGYLALDYAKLADCVAEKMDYAEYIEIADLLDASDYYNTDTHWRQDKIVDVAERIAAAMDVDIKAEYKKEMLGQPFNGVYVGQAAIKVEPDTISYLTNNAIENVVLEGAQAVYDMDKAVGKDPYEMFLSGNQPVITIKNKENESGRRLVVFRDSFGSSIAPLWMEGYSEIVLVDLRYIPSSMLGEYVDFTDADVLFLYSTMMLNNSKAMR